MKPKLTEESPSEKKLSDTTGKKLWQLVRRLVSTDTTSIEPGSVTFTLLYLRGSFRSIRQGLGDFALDRTRREREHSS